MFNTIIPTFRYWKIKIPIYSLYKKSFQVNKEQRTVLYTENEDKGWGREGEQKDRYSVALSECALTDWGEREVRLLQ